MRTCSSPQPGLNTGTCSFPQLSSAQPMPAAGGLMIAWRPRLSFPSSASGGSLPLYPRRQPWSPHPPAPPWPRATPAAPPPDPPLPSVHACPRGDSKHSLPHACSPVFEAAAFCYVSTACPPKRCLQLLSHAHCPLVNHSSVLYCFAACSSITCSACCHSASMGMLFLTFAEHAQSCVHVLRCLASAHVGCLAQYLLPPVP